MTDDGVAVFRPVELVMLRPSAGARFRYAGAGTFWDPAPVDGEAMRGAPRRVGNVLRERVGLRGVFGIDGILGEDGFVATELNPRFAAGLGYVTAALPELAFDLLHRVVAAGDGHEVVAADLETVVVDAADGRRRGAGWATAGRSWPRTGHHRLVALGDGHRPATDEEEADALLHNGPGATGGFVRVTFAPRRMHAGRSIASSVVAALAWADAALQAGVGHLAPAVEVR